MNLKNYQITLGELLESQEARAVLRREYPMLWGMPLQSAVNYARGSVPPSQLRRVLGALEKA